jgi:hypothetical protein
MQIEQRTLDSIRPYSRNPRRNDSAVKQVAESITAFGFRQPIVVDDAGVIVVGHTRYKAAQQLGLATVPVTVMSGYPAGVLNQYRIADNRLNELAEWDDTLLIAELEDILKTVGSTDLTGFSADDLKGLREEDLENRHYTTLVDTPIYTPKGAQPTLDQLTDSAHVNRLLEQIQLSTAPEDIKQFLQLAAQRHRVFDYESIAEYYCHADPTVRKLFEQSALVICDIDSAIENGYVRMTSTLREIFKKDHVDE